MIAMLTRIQEYRNLWDIAKSIKWTSAGAHCWWTRHFAAAQSGLATHALLWTHLGTNEDIVLKTVLMKIAGSNQKIAQNRSPIAKDAKNDLSIQVKQLLV